MRHVVPRLRSGLALSAAALGCLTLLTACGSSSSDSSGTTTSAQGALALAHTSLGTIVTDSAGMTVYVYDKDTQGTTSSACKAGCLGVWPPVEITGSPTAASGLTGTLGTITAPDGGKQLTLDGLPLYTYAGDKAAGDVTGQGFDGIWWVVGPTGTKLTGTATTSPSTSTSPDSGGGRGGY